MWVYFNSELVQLGEYDTGNHLWRRGIQDVATKHTITTKAFFALY